MAYPFVDCDTHGAHQLGYCVCVHVLTGAAIDHRVEPDGWDLGEVLCAACHHPGVTSLRLICARCVDDIFATRGVPR